MGLAGCWNRIQDSTAFDCVSFKFFPVVIAGSLIWSEWGRHEICSRRDRPRATKLDPCSAQWSVGKQYGTHTTQPSLAHTFDILGTFTMLPDLFQHFSFLHSTFNIIFSHLNFLASG